jgi:hypothetical protein
MTGAGVTSAAKQPTPQDCLDLYKYFSDNRKSNDPVAIKQALDAAQVFQTQCKMTEEQKAGVGQAITSSQNRLQRIQSETSQNKSPASELFNGAEAVKKGDISGLKQKIIENLKQNIRPYQKTNREQVRITPRDIFKPPFDDYVTTLSGSKDINILGDQNKITISWVNYYSSTYGIASDLNSSSTGKITATITLENVTPFDGDFDIGYLGAKCSTENTEFWRGKTDYNTSDYCSRLPYGIDNDGKYVGGTVAKELSSLISQLKNGLLGNNPRISSEDETANLPKIEPTTIEQYQKKVVAEAKAKGITLPPNFLTEAPSENKKLPESLTPTQRTARNSQLTKELDELIAQDETEAKEAEKRLVTEKNRVNQSLQDGTTAFKNEDYDLALTKFDEGINADPDFAGTAPILLNNKALTLRLRAMRFYKQSNTNTANKASLMQQAKNDFTNAILASQRALDILKSATGADVNAQKTYESAKYSALSNILESYRLMIGTKADQTKISEYANALIAYEAVETNPAQKLNNQILTADTLRLSSSSKEALLIYRRAIEIAPNNVDLLAGIGLVLFDLGITNSDKKQMQDATNYLQKFVDNAPSTHPLGTSIQEALNYLKNTEKLTPQRIP